MTESGNWRRSVLVGLAIVGAVLIYAYGFDVTSVKFTEIRSPDRISRLINITRALFRPDILEYDREEFQVNAPIAVPCPAGGVSFPAPDTGGPYLVITPPCAEPSTEITVEGFNFEPNTKGPLNFIPPSGVSLKMGDIETDAEGHFVATVKLPKRPSEEIQTVRAVTRRQIGAPKFSHNAQETWNKIIETVFVALLATTLSTLLAVPLSFFAAHNLMKDVTSPLASLALSILAWPAGIVAGALLAGWLTTLGASLSTNVALSLGGLAVSPVVMFALTRWALPQNESQKPAVWLRIARFAALLVATLLGVLVVFLVSSLAQSTGAALAKPLGAAGFLGTFIQNIGSILELLVMPLTALIGGAVLSSFGGSLGQIISQQTSGLPNRLINMLLATAAGLTLAALIGAGIGWLYEVDNLANTVYIPAGIGALAGLVLALFTRRQEALPIGLVVYYVARTVFNALRSIEALIMVIWFVVWVGIGPFAGMLALALHSIAAMAKLYSEQVESILSGPIEAVKATGATRLQTIIYAVLPQVIPPYISFTMYRWDINVRMSTIIGFAGGGGIGFLLQQNVNLLNYRGAATQILAIAIVVATMDYLSAKLREKVI